MKENFHIFIDYLDFLVSCVFSESINSDKVGNDRTTLNLFYGSERMMHFHAGGIIVFQKSSVYGNYKQDQLLYCITWNIANINSH